MIARKATRKIIKPEEAHKNIIEDHSRYAQFIRLSLQFCFCRERRGIDSIAIISYNDDHIYW